jgi:Raf kinase inhibitor-like YbhB/YbcL family protein
MRTERRNHWNFGRGLKRGACSGVVGLLLVFGLPGCHGAGPAVRVPALTLTSTSFEGSQIPPKFTCNGAGISPQLAWSAPPAGTASFALTVTDPDASVGTFVHWVLYDLPADARSLPEGLSKQGQFADGSRQGRNDFGDLGYGGPCPPRHSTHHYLFTLYALNAKLKLAAGATCKQVEAAIEGHILARGELIGLYHQ